MSDSIKGYVHSIQTMGTLDGPGVRFVVFMQGCNLRCGCCHNPDTWAMKTGTEYTPTEIADKAIRYREYFGEDGGITVSGGEPLLQAKFVHKLFKICHERGINTCIDTSGDILNDDVKTMLTETDRVLLDIKYTDNELYSKHVGCDMDKPMAFLSYLEENQIPVTLRQVIIPTINDNAENILNLKEIVAKHSWIDKTELLPFRKICRVKYDKMNIPFPFGHLPEPTRDSMAELNKILNS